MKPSKQIPPRYEQPDPCAYVRSLNGSLETVRFLPESHLRIWYNIQSEGYASHYHDALEIIVCAEHQYIIAANNQAFTLNRGDILIIPPYMLHELSGTPHGARFIFLIDISMLKCFQDFKTLDPIFMKPFLCTSSNHSDIYAYIYNTLMQMVEIYFSHNLFWETSIYSLLLNVLLTIGRHHFYNSVADTLQPASTKQQEYYEIFANLLNYIDAHYADDLTLEQAADYSGFSKYHFARLFKQHTHTTYHHYLCHKRIQAAQFLLTNDTELTVTNIAFRVGFNNLATFCRCFTKYANCSPTEYRNKLRKEEPI